MKTLVVFAMLFATSAFAKEKGYDIKLELALNGKIISSPRLLVRDGEKAVINQKKDSEESFIEVVAKEGASQDHKGIMMHFKVGRISKGGHRTIISNPQVLVSENKLATFMISDKENGSEQLSLSVLAQRKDL